MPLNAPPTSKPPNHPLPPLAVAPLITSGSQLVLLLLLLLFILPDGVEVASLASSGWRSATRSDAATEAAAVPLFGS